MFATVSQFLAEAADKFALQVLETDRYFDAVGWALTKTERWHQRECPLKAPLVMWLILAGVFYRAESLKSILAKVLNQYRQESPGLPLDAVTPEAACKARQRLGVEPVAAVFRRLAEDVRGTISFKGLRLWSIDGTFLSVADEEANEAAFGRKASSRGKTAYPQVHVTQLCDTATRLVKDVVLGRCDRVSERRDALALIEHLGKGDLLLWDCGFSAVWFFHKCLQRNIHAIGRIGAGWNPTILKTISDGDYIVSVEGPIPKAHRSKRGTASVRLKLRMIVYQVGNDDPVRATSVVILELSAQDIRESRNLRVRSEGRMLMSATPSPHAARTLMSCGSWGWQRVAKGWQFGHPVAEVRGQCQRWSLRRGSTGEGARRQGDGYSAARGEGVRSAQPVWKRRERRGH